MGKLNSIIVLLITCTSIVGCGKGFTPKDSNSVASNSTSAPSPSPAPAPTPAPAPSPAPAPAPTCPKGTAYQDGCSGASAGSPQFPSLLSSYVKIPPWNVAGVDFAVGIPSGTSLKDPRTATLPSGCSLSSSVVTCSGTVTVDGYDFSLHNGTSLSIISGNVTVQNSLFIVGSSQGSTGTILTVTGNTNATFLHNEFNGANIAVTVGFGATINATNTGTIIFKYNYFHNSGGDMIDFGEGPQVEIVQFNVFKDVGLNTDHSDTIQWCSSVVNNSDLSFNVMAQTVAGLSGMGLLEPNSECPGSNISNMLVHNNTMISKVQDNFATGVDVTQDAGAASGDHVAIFDNYVDPTGIMSFTASPWFPTGYYQSDLAHPSLLHTLIDMTKGTPIPVPSKTNNQSSAPYYVYPDSSGYTPGLSDLYTMTATPVSGSVAVGGTVVFTLNMAEPWIVTGSPRLTLSNVGVAQYSSGSGSNTLKFSYTVTAGQGATNLAVTAVNLNGGSIKDAFGNSANLSGAITTFSGLTISN